MLEISCLSKTFNKGTINQKVAIENLSLTFQEGDFVTVIGGNGAGKSTLLNLIAGVYPADAGQVMLDGQNITKMPEHKRARLLGRVFQDPMMGTAAGMGIEENLAMAYRRGKSRGLRWGISAKEREKYCEKLKTLDLGLEGRLSTKVGLLSGGQRQALTLLMATLQKPKLLLLDEHTAALDPRTAAKVLALSDHIIAKHGLTAMMVTHNMRDAIEHGNRLIMMHEGSIALDIAGDAKKQLTVEDLIARFSQVSGQKFANDRALLS
ncbi:MAG: ABC transporter ATP-binding protein [Candidatus Pelethousia sp.]|nr:ABC transporter ATP-binding protein [Candidatus Pelethousia sp.]